MMVRDLKAQLVEIGPGVAGAEAEATVSTQSGKDVFLHGFYFEGCSEFIVTEKSVFGTMNSKEPVDEKNCIERYDEYAETKKSSYRKVFTTLNQMLKLIEG